VAAARKLHTSQPSLSRQIRDLEDEVGTPLLTRRPRGIELTPAGRTFLDHARVVLAQAEAASEAARRVAHSIKPCFRMGFLTGHELTWMPEALRILRDELPNIDVMISSQYSPLLADGLSKGKIDVAFLRRERGLPKLAYKFTRCPNSLAKIATCPCNVAPLKGPTRSVVTFPLITPNPLKNGPAGLRKIGPSTPAPCTVLAPSPGLSVGPILMLTC
jgi:DNA-binding transcriptional LysR family regulator